MTSLSKNANICAILEFYTAGYITTIEKDELIAKVYKAWRSKAKQQDVSTVVEGRELCYSYVYQSNNNKQCFIRLSVNGDFYILYYIKNGSFTVIDNKENNDDRNGDRRFLGNGC